MRLDQNEYKARTLFEPSKLKTEAGVRLRTAA
jgi:hypothetical protein